MTPLLRFAQTSQYARNLAYSNVQDLSLAIYPSHRNSWYNKVFIAQHKPKYALDAAIQIPQARNFNYSTLAIFHDKIVASILSRHAYTLQRVDLTLWKLSIPVANALTQLPALRELSIRIAMPQTVPRAEMTAQRKEENEAWSLLTSKPAFMASINALTIENAEINAMQLSDLLVGTGRLKDLWLSKCNMLTSSLWSSAQLRRLYHLSLSDCTNVHIHDLAVETISKMDRLQVRRPQSKRCQYSCRG